MIKLFTNIMAWIYDCDPSEFKNAPMTEEELEEELIEYANKYGDFGCNK
jgi:hypothetical protein